MLLKLRMSRWTVLFSSVIPAKRTGPLLWIKIFLKNYPQLLEAYTNQVLQHSLEMKARGDVHANKCCYNLGCPFGRYYFPGKQHLWKLSVSPRKVLKKNMKRSKKKFSVLMESFLNIWLWGNYVQVNNHNADFEMHRTFYFGPNLRYCGWPCYC